MAALIFDGPRTRHDQAFDRRFGPLIYLKVNPIWDPLRLDPRFAEYVRRVGLQP